jgi:hypothetical protein
MILKNWRKFSQKIAKLVEFTLRKTKNPKEIPNFCVQKKDKNLRPTQKKKTLYRTEQGKN